MSHRLAFLGLGVMGYPMAGHLARAGHRLTVYNRSVEKAERWVGQFGGTAVTPSVSGECVTTITRTSVSSTAASSAPKSRGRVRSSQSAVLTPPRR